MAQNYRENKGLNTAQAKTSECDFQQPSDSSSSVPSIASGSVRSARCNVACRLPDSFQRRPRISNTNLSAQNERLKQLELETGKYGSSVTSPRIMFPPPPPYPPEVGNDYSYAYYEPGTVIENRILPANSEAVRKYCYITRYGTEENIYEEIKNQQNNIKDSLVAEVRYVHSRHEQVLNELDLNMEDMLCPEPSRNEIIDPSNSLDSGFNSGTNSLRKPPVKIRSSSKFWRKLPAFSSSSSQNISDDNRNETEVWEETLAETSSSIASEHETSSSDENSQFLERTESQTSTEKSALGKNRQHVAGAARLYRLFSFRSDTDLHKKCAAIALLPEVDELCKGGKFEPLKLPPAPPNLSPQELKRRHIFSEIVETENNYSWSMTRLVYEYKKPLEMLPQPILSQRKISWLFYRVPEILQCHTLFRIGLADAVANWDVEGRVGEAVFSSFSKNIVLEIYSGFINNFSEAMELARSQTKKKPALMEFFETRQANSEDRLSFFGLMVKPVQRFPQFILLLQALLHHTAHNHADRLSLQLALTQLETVAELLNERKREAEQAQAFRRILRSISGKLTGRLTSATERCLRKQDDVFNIVIASNAESTRIKKRRLLLMNDALACVSVKSKSDSSSQSNERLNVKWSANIWNVQVVENNRAALSKILRNPSNDAYAGNLCQQLNDLTHDFQIVSRIADLIAILKGNYAELTITNARLAMSTIQKAIREKDAEMAWVDACILQLYIDKNIHTFQMHSPMAKKDWLTELRLAKLALHPNNTPAWDVPEQDLDVSPLTKLPLFVGNYCIPSSDETSEVVSGCYYSSVCGKLSYLWLCTASETRLGSTISVISVNGSTSMTEIDSIHLQDKITALEVIRASETVWMGTTAKRILIYNLMDTSEVARINLTVDGAVTRIKQHCDSIFVGTSEGILLLFKRGNRSNAPDIIELGQRCRVSCLLPINMSLYVACGRQVSVVNAITGEIQKCFSISDHAVGTINLMAHSGVGLWISQTNSTVVCLYHTESFKHLQDINIGSNVTRVANTQLPILVTSMMACKGVLWVGTDAGVSVTIPLPRLEGVPIISGRGNVSYHAHSGPVRLVLPLQDAPTVHKRPPSKALAYDIYGLYGQLMRVQNYDQQHTDSDVAATNSKSEPHFNREPTLISISCGRGYIRYNSPTPSDYLTDNVHVLIWETKL